MPPHHDFGRARGVLNWGDAFLEERPRAPAGGKSSACAPWSVWPPRRPRPWVADRAAAFRRMCLGVGLDLLP
jgi:hypothetical protein